jgi:hypothetical protein
MLCYVMLCYVILFYVCYVILCYVMLCYVIFCYVMLCYVMLSLSLRDALRSAANQTRGALQFISCVSYRPDYLSPYFDVTPISMI